MTQHERIYRAITKEGGMEIRILVEKMERNVTKSELMEILEQQIIATEFWQDRPYTAVNLTIKHDGELYLAFGFSKACYPDLWDAEFGKDLAVKKAVAKVAKRILILKDAEPTLRCRA